MFHGRTIVFAPIPSGYICHGSYDSINYDKLKDAHVAIIGHGGFTIENVRTCVERNAKKARLSRTRDVGSDGCSTSNSPMTNSQLTTYVPILLQADLHTFPRCAQALYIVCSLRLRS